MKDDVRNLITELSEVKFDDNKVAWYEFSELEQIQAIREDYK